MSLILPSQEKPSESKFSVLNKGYDFKNALKVNSYIALILALSQCFFYLLIHVYLTVRLGHLSNIFQTVSDSSFLINNFYLVVFLFLGVTGLAWPLYKARLGYMRSWVRQILLVFLILSGAMGAWAQTTLNVVRKETQAMLSTIDLYQVEKESLNNFLQINQGDNTLTKALTYDSPQCAVARKNVETWNKIEANSVGALLQKSFNGILYESNCLKPQEYFDRVQAIKEAQNNRLTALDLLFPIEQENQKYMLSKLNNTPYNWCIIQPEAKNVPSSILVAACQKAKGPEILTHPLSLKEMGVDISGFSAK